MSKENNIFGCFVKTTADPAFNNDEEIFAKGALFRSYIWGDNGICEKINQLNFEDYGSDIELILFEFQVFPMQVYKPIDYSKRQKSVGIPIIVNNENFFNESEERRWLFLKKTIVEKLELFIELAKKKKLDTDVESLKFDLIEILK